MSITIRFACGHGFSLEPTSDVAPVCPTCGERRVSRVDAPAPRFTGWVTGPSAESAPLPAVPVLMPKEPSHG